MPANGSRCNVVASTIARESDGVIYTHAGPEIGVASTKAFTTQLVALYLMAIHLARARRLITRREMSVHLTDLAELPRKIEDFLKREPEVAAIARKYKDARDFLYLGRGISYPIALEGALKLKEISYVHAEGRQHAVHRLQPHFVRVRPARTQLHRRYRLLVVARRAS